MKVILPREIHKADTPIPSNITKHIFEIAELESTKGMQVSTTLVKPHVMAADKGDFIVNMIVEKMSHLDSSLLDIAIKWLSQREIRIIYPNLKPEARCAYDIEITRAPVICLIFTGYNLWHKLHLVKGKYGESGMRTVLLEEDTIARQDINVGRARNIMHSPGNISEELDIQNIIFGRSLLPQIHNDY